MSQQVSDHLQKWLLSAVDICGSDTNDESSVDAKALAVGQSVLGLDENASLDDIRRELSDIYQEHAVFDDATVMVELLLVHAVSEHSEKRGEFVEAIMNLDTEAQMYLMQVIQDHHFVEEEDMDDEGEGDAEEEAAEEVVDDEEQLVTSMVEIADVPGAAATPAHVSHHGEWTMHSDGHNSSICVTCAEKDAHIKKMQQDAKQTIAKDGEEIFKLKEEVGALNNKLVDMEVLLMQKDSAIFENSQALKELCEQKERNEQTVAKNNKLEEQILVLQDELELLKPQAAKLDFAEAQIDRLRSKLDELTDIKQQLKVESANHSETYDKLVILEQEAEGLRKMKTQVEDYRSQFAETSIAMQELQLRLEDSEAETVSLRAEVVSLRGDQTEHRHQAQHLAEELRTTAEQLRQKERMNGIGEGMSELNPALMQELNRLKNENKDLFEKLDQSAVDKLEALRKDSEEVKSINTSLQKKWMSTKDALAKAENDIRSLTFRLHEKDAECVALRFQIAETARMNDEDVTARKLKHARELAFERKTQHDLLTLTHQGHNTVVGIYSESLAQAHSHLEQTQQEVEDLTSLQANTAESLANTENELQEAGRKRKCLEMEHVEAIFALNEEFETKIEARAKKHKSELDTLQEETTQAIALERQQMEQTIEAGRREMEQRVAAERQKAADLVVELENEARRRRTTERAKKTAELESQRLKLQLNAAMGADAGGDGVKSALQAITDMQQELAEAHAEIASLRARPAAAMDDSSGGEVAKSSAASASSLHAPPARALRSSAKAAASEPTFNNISYSGYLEQSDIAEKKIEQLTREKREQISKNLEEQRERHEVAQRLLVMEKENNTLKAELRKITLDKERNERKLNKQLEMFTSQSACNKENLRN